MAYQPYPYGGYQPAPSYYPSPVPDQLAQLRQQQMQQSMMQQPVQPMQANPIQQPAPQSGGINWVGSKMEADNWPIAPGCAVALWDSNNPVIYLRQYKFYIYMYNLHPCLCTVYMPGTHRGQIPYSWSY